MLSFVYIFSLAVKKINDYFFKGNIITEENVFSREVTIELSQPSEDNSFTMDNFPEESDVVWLKVLERQWQVKQPIDWSLEKCLQESQNPYKTALYLMKNSTGFRMNKSNTLSCTIMKIFSDWIIPQRSNYVALLTDSLMIEAFSRTYKQIPVLFEATAKAFLLNKKPDLFLKPISEMLKKKQFKEAAQCIITLELQDHFPIEEMVFPLLSEGRNIFLEKFVKNSKELQLKLCQILDKYCGDNTSVEDILQNFHIKEKKQLSMQSIKSFLARLIQQYNIPFESCSNFRQSRRYAAMRYHILTKVHERIPHCESWKEMLEDIVADHPKMHKDVVMMFNNFGDTKYAAYWAKQFNISSANLPFSINSYLSEPESFESQFTIAEDVVEDEKFYSLNIPFEEIHFIDSLELYLRCIQDIEQNYKMVGVDGEWKPNFGIKTNAPISVLQLAVSNKVYILDMLVLSKILNDMHWQILGQKIFMNSNVFKLVYGFHSDIKILNECLPVLKKSLSPLISFIFLDSEAKSSYNTGASAKHQNSDTEKNENTYKGLSELVHSCFGKPLNKIERMSNWEKRPLRKAQLIYAALDAYCLLEIYQVLQAKNSATTNTYHNLHQSVLKIKEEKAQISSQRSIQSETRQALVVPNPVTASVSLEGPQQLKVVVDTMLQGLGRQLRCIGVDVRILENSEEHEKALEIALKEKRIILTTGTPYDVLKKQVPSGMCINIKCMKARDQLAEVMKLFNLKVSPKDIFTRCQNCNGNLYIKMPSKLIKYLKEHKKNSDNQPAVERPTFLPNFAEIQIAELNATDHHYIKNINMRNISFSDNNVPIQLDLLPDAIVDNIDMFYVCSSCGKIFWIGSHFHRVLNQMADIMDPNAESTTVYDRN